MSDWTKFLLGIPATYPKPGTHVEMAHRFSTIEIIMEGEVRTVYSPGFDVEPKMSLHNVTITEERTGLDEQDRHTIHWRYQPYPERAP